MASTGPGCAVQGQSGPGRVTLGGCSVNACAIETTPHIGVAGGPKGGVRSREARERHRLRAGLALRDGAPRAHVASPRCPAPPTLGPERPRPLHHE